MKRSGLPKAELRRQAAHVALGSFFIAVAALFGMFSALLAVLVLLAAGLILAAAIAHGFKVPLVCRVVDCVQRGHEMRVPGRGAFMLCFGFVLMLALGVFVFRPGLIALGALAVLVYGDAASTVFGKLLGRHRFRGLSIEGTLGGIAVSFGMLLQIFPLPAALAAAVLGMLAEYLPGDDSFTIPVAAGFALMLLL